VTRRLRLLPLRAKLTLVFACVMAVVLAAVGLFLHLRTRSNLDVSIDSALHARSGNLIQSLGDADGRRPVIEPGERFAQVLDTSGHVLASRPAGAPPLLSAAEARRLARAGGTLERAERERLFVRPATSGGRPVLAVVATSLADRERAIEGLDRALLLGGPLALAIASALAYAIAAGALRPVDHMRERAAAITAADDDARLPVPEPRDEVRRLAETLNDMLGRLADAAAHERSFVANASHELRTPLAILRTELELALRHGDAHAALRSAIADVDRLSRLADDLLVLARADGGRLPVRREEVAVARLLEEIAASFRPRLAAAGRGLDVQAPPGLTVRADPLRLAQALSNLLENAERHGAGDVTLAGAVRSDGRVDLEVRDAGPPLPDEVLQAAFTRFARFGRAPGGAGLGLAIVAAIADAHGGHATLENGPGGVAARLTLPGGGHAVTPERAAPAAVA
jgi:signal transduction histidine kinase